MEVIDPAKRAANQVIDDFPAAKVEYNGTPVCVFTFSGVFMFVQGSSVKTPKTVLVLWKMCRHPVYNDTNTCPVEPVHQEAEIIRLPKTLCRCVHTDGLITPGTIERMLGHRHQFHMRKVHLLDIGHQIISQFSVGQELIVFTTSPGTKVHLVNTDGLRHLWNR